MPNPNEDLPKEGEQNQPTNTPAPAEGEGTPPKEPTMADVIKGVNQVGDSLGGITERLGTLEEKLQPPKEEPKMPPHEEPPKEGEEGYQPETWDQVKKDTEETAKETAERVYKENEEKKQKEREERKRIREDEKAQIDKNFDDQLTQLETEGELTPIKEDNKDDAGKVERRKIFVRANNLDTTNLVAVGKEIKQMKKQGLDFDVETGQFIRMNQPNPGQNAPIGSSSNRTSNASNKPTYEEIHNTSMDELARRASEE